MEQNAERPLNDYPKLPSSAFRFDNAARFQNVFVNLELRERCLTIGDGFQLIGWCDCMPTELMLNRAGQVGLMLWHPEHEHLWVHCPLFEAVRNSISVKSIQ